MTPDYIRLRAEWTCEQALDHIRKYGRDSEIFNILYVTDAGGKLVDLVRMRRLIMAPPKTVIKEMLNYNCISLSAYDDREVAVEQIQRYDVNALPVVDSDGVLLGIVTVDDIMDVAEEEATEDIQKGVAVAPLETKYSAAKPTQLFRKRIVWLLVLIFVNLISAGVISHYEELVKSMITLALFMPLVIASGGNCGAQSATLMVRAIATGDLELSDWWTAVWKEILVGILLGVAMAVIAGGWGTSMGGFRRGADCWIQYGGHRFCGQCLRCLAAICSKPREGRSCSCKHAVDHILDGRVGADYLLFHCRGGVGLVPARWSLGRTPFWRLKHRGTLLALDDLLAAGVWATG